MGNAAASARETITRRETEVRAPLSIIGKERGKNPFSFLQELSQKIRRNTNNARTLVLFIFSYLSPSISPFPSALRDIGGKRRQFLCISMKFYQAFDIPGYIATAVTSNINEKTVRAEYFEKEIQLPLLSKRLIMSCPQLSEVHYRARKNLAFLELKILISE